MPTGTRNLTVIRSEAFTTLREGCQACRACPLYAKATQAVPGAGNLKASVMLVGEQPGDEEDRRGQPFVGPAGRVLDALLDEAGGKREELFLTNAVKHFKFEERGKRRLHQKPKTVEVRACRPWLVEEIALVRPRLIVALGATATASLLGPKVRLSDVRGTKLTAPPDLGDVAVIPTFHPAALLRMPDPAKRRENRQLVLRDLALAFAGR